MIILDWLCWIYVVEFLPICRDLKIFMMMYIDLMTCIFWRCMTFIRCDCWGILYMHVVWIWCEDVASISWIYALFACIIALIEIGRYMKQRLFQMDLKALDAYFWRALKKDIYTKCTTTISTTLILCLLVQEQQMCLQQCSSRLGMDLKLLLHRTITKSGKRPLVIWSSFKRLFLMCWQSTTSLSHRYIKEWRLAVWILTTHTTIYKCWNKGCFAKSPLEFWW